MNLLMIPTYVPFKIIKWLVNFGYPITKEVVIKFCESNCSSYIIKWFIKKGCPIDDSIYYYAVRMDCLELLQFYIKCVGTLNSEK
jgi:hypothetical protein